MTHKTLQKYRKKSKLTNGEIARTFNCSESYISKIMHGAKPLPKEMRPTLFALLGIQDKSA